VGKAESLLRPEGLKSAMGEDEPLLYSAPCRKKSKAMERPEKIASPNVPWSEWIAEIFPICVFSKRNQLLPGLHFVARNR
jgi:hypothetical protein